ncbi:MAG: alpha-glucosidase/alpha-galactosidase, partial [Candidatus Hydrogenedens sp.]
MPKIAMIGAGSIVFCKTLFMDLVSVPAFQDAEFWFMSPTRKKLERMKSFADRVVKDNGLKVK